MPRSSRPDKTPDSGDLKHLRRSDGGRQTRVLVVEHETLFRSLITECLSSAQHINVVAAVASGSEAIAAAEKHTPDVVLMDIDLGREPDGIRTGHLIKAAHPSIGIVILSTRSDKEYLASIPVKQSGGWSFLLKRSISDSTSLIRAIDGAAWGLVSIDPAFLDDSEPSSRSLLERLTRPQIYVLRQMAAGHADGGIAEILGLEGSEVRSLVGSIYEDLHIADDDSVDPRVTAILTYLRETSRSWL